MSISQNSNSAIFQINRLLPPSLSKMVKRLLKRTTLKTCNDAAALQTVLAQYLISKLQYSNCFFRSYHTIYLNGHVFTLLKSGGGGGDRNKWDL